jgi:hypothetical protein
VAVLAFQFGDGFTNMIIPTNAVLMGILGMAGIPYDKWFRFCLPLVLKLFVAAAVAWSWCGSGSGDLRGCGGGGRSCTGRLPLRPGPPPGAPQRQWVSISSAR